MYFVNIYRAAGYPDCTNGGVSSKFEHAILYRKGHVPDELPKGHAALVIEDSPRAGAPYLRAVPADAGDAWVMFGGNFVWSTDSRFRQEVSERPIPVHDRIEG